MARNRSTKLSTNSSTNIGFEQKLWLAADSRSEAEITEGNRSSGLAIRGIKANVGDEQADTFRRDLHRDLRADFVLANPPFNDSDWFRKDDDPRWQFGLPPRGNANFAWVQHFIYHLAPTGMAGFASLPFSFGINECHRANSREETGSGLCASNEGARAESKGEDRHRKAAN